MDALDAGNCPAEGKSTARIHSLQFARFFSTNRTVFIFQNLTEMFTTDRAQMASEKRRPRGTILEAALPLQAEVAWQTVHTKPPFFWNCQ